MVSDVLIIGAGLSGLMAANALKEQGLSFTILDKGRSVGGRLATRRIESGVADTGAQFFTVRSDRFRKYVDAWVAAGLIYEWSTGWSDGSLKRTRSDGHSRFAVYGGMNKLAKHLAEGLDNIHVDSQVTTITFENDIWTVKDSENNAYSGKALLMTPPVPQSLELLDFNRIMLSKNDEIELKRINYGPCLCGLFLVEGEVTIPDPGAVQDFENPVYWIADNQRKGISPDARVLTVHSGATFSRQHWDNDDESVLVLLNESLEAYLGSDSRIVESQLKRWLYSVPLTTYPEECLVAEELPNLVFAGDAFGGRGRVEGAALSGLAAGKALIEILR